MNYASIEIQCSPSSDFDSRHPAYRKMKKAGGVSKYYTPSSNRYVRIPSDAHEAIDAIIAAATTPRGGPTVVIRDMDDEMRAAMTHGGTVQAWAVVYNNAKSAADIDARVASMVVHVAQRNAA